MKYDVTIVYGNDGILRTARNVDASSVDRSIAIAQSYLHGWPANGRGNETDTITIIVSTTTGRKTAARARAKQRAKDRKAAAEAETISRLREREAEAIPYLRERMLS